jgi:hypothetical protein
MNLRKINASLRFLGQVREDKLAALSFNQLCALRCHAARAAENLTARSAVIFHERRREKKGSR